MNGIPISFTRRPSPYSADRLFNRRDAIYGWINGLITTLSPATQYIADLMEGLTREACVQESCGIHSVQDRTEFPKEDLSGNY